MTSHQEEQIKRIEARIKELLLIRKHLKKQHQK